MARPCSVCHHPERPAIDQGLVSGASSYHLAARYGVSPDAISRHFAAHVPAALVQAQEAEDVAHAIDVVKQLKAINLAAVSILAEARKSKDHDTALKAIDRIQRQIELQARLLGELDDRPQVNVLVAPEWLAVRSAVLAALAPYPAARVAVANRLVMLDASAEAAL